MCLGSWKEISRMRENSVGSNAAERTNKMRSGTWPLDSIMCWLLVILIRAVFYGVLKLKREWYYKM